ncbi:cyclic phosphodiesterase-like [Pyrus ussuriensis x Pyrus communis]|uniref:Cyclic phosphodiesterase-like n=1 Tax=Pyrus ussuriensis x Pyrus communis TaxID=2448454 RepID=A0A5N5H354_9ROSA|nr:cyclic phosphodiesterase-like [Pyrus ussuriensis x Pyrus communis]
MGGLRAEFGGPQIEPHIPLEGSLLLTCEAALANRSDLCLRAFVAKVDSVVTRVSYYHPVALMETGVDFNLWNPPLPQMSLLYGHLTEEERKKAQEKVYILDESITGLSFPVTHIVLYQTNYKDKTLRSWEKIAEYRLHFNN